MPVYKVLPAQDGKRLDVLLSRVYPDYSRAFMQKWIKEGRVTLAGRDMSPSYHVRAGETFEIADFQPSPVLRHPLPKGRGQSPAFSLQGEGARRADEGLPAPVVLFEDASILVLNKPANLVVHPAPSHKGPTLIDWLKDHLGPKVTGLFSDSSRLGVVHRLDKDTTGVLLVAKTVIAQNKLGKQFQDRQVKKTYAAFVEGVPESSTGIISAPVGRSRQAPSRMAVSSAGRPSETSFEVVKSYGEVSQMNLYPKTGRTHQIRVHCAAIGHPIVGDKTYGSSDKWSKKFGIQRPLLHAERLELEHPVTHKKLKFEAPWPADMKKALIQFRGMVKILLVAFLIGSVARSRPLHADDSSASKAAVKPKTAVPVQMHTSLSVQALKRDVASLHDQFKSLIEEVSALQDRVTSVQSSLDELNASSRIHDLEKAISDLNGKSVGNSNVAEEAKSQVLDLSRKVKSQQETLDDLRDQIDHLKSELIQAKAHADGAPPSPAPEAGK